MIRWNISLLGLALAVFALVALSGPGRIDIEDGQARFESGQNLLRYGDPGIRDPRVVWHRFPGRGGVDFTYYRFPGEFVAAAAVAVADAFSSTDEPLRHFLFSMHGAVLAAILAVVFAIWFGRQGHSPRAAMVWAAAGIACTPCWYYAASTFDDLLGTLAVVAALVAADRARSSIIGLVLSAIAIGFALNCKQPLAAVLLPALALADAPRARWLRAAVLGLGFVAGYAGYLAYEAWKFPPESKLLHAAIMEEHGLTVFDGKPQEALLDYLIGPSAGAIWYCPTVLLGLAGLLAWWRRGHRTVVLAMLAAIVAMVGFFAMLTFYKGGVCWGPRYLTPVFGMLWLFAPAGVSILGTRLATGLLALGAIVQVLGLATVPERIYVEQSVPSGFYRVDPWLYFEPAISHLARRPHEIADAMSAPPAAEFTPGPTPTFSMPVFDPPYYTGPKGREGVRRYVLLNSLRPWWAIFPHLPAEQQPVDLAKAGLSFTALGLFGLLLIVAGLRNSSLNTNRS